MFILATLFFSMSAILQQMFGGCQGRKSRELRLVLRPGRRGFLAKDSLINCDRF
jgi:hypothetical protein